jgi:cobalt-zinc-cadmium resistance protein CzcA
MPRLDEGTQVIEISRLPSTSLDESLRTSGLIEKLLVPMPEVATVVSKTGRPEIANDLAGPEQTDCYVMLKPRGQWPEPLLDIEVLQERIEQALLAHVPGLVSLGFSQPIEMRTHELLSGVRADLAVQLYGDDLQTLAALGAQVATLIKSVPGAADLRVDRLDGLSTVSIRPDRLAMGRLGIDARTLSDSVTAVGGRVVGTILEGEERYALTVRLAARYRNDLEAIARLPLKARNGEHVALQDVAELLHVDDPVVINREGAKRRLVVQANVRSRDLGGFSQEVQAALQHELHLPPGYRMHLGGNFENLQRARQRLMWLVPLTLALIGGLLVATFQDGKAAAVIFMTVPFSATGGVMLLWARGLPLSISAAVGFIALFGIATLNGLVLVSEMREQRQRGTSPLQAAVGGARRRLLPVLTTASVAALGFVPMALSHGAGAEVQRPLATVIIGGLCTATTMTLLALPTLWLTVAAGPSAQAHSGLVGRGSKA